MKKVTAPLIVAVAIIVGAGTFVYQSNAQDTKTVPIVRVSGDIAESFKQWLI